MIQRYGVESYFLAGELQIIDEDENFGTLLEHKTPVFESESFRMLQVTNSTPEPDGNQKTYLIRVPPDVETAHEAAAWTFRMEAEEYKPDKET
ncbi:MAG: hypothetical protein K2Z81_00325 [Cyanobacteria bacterium]|nr:hypothetical protein [Cyanobacteriota bacterium]